MSTVRLTRSRHPFEGRPLEVLGRMRRHGDAAPFSQEWLASLKKMEEKKKSQ